MAKQKINAEKLENLLSNLKVIENTTLDTLSSIRDKYLKLTETEVWTGPKSEAFCESLKGYWNISAEFIGPVSDSYRGPMLENLNVEFESLNNFINTALGKVTNTDEETAKTLTQEEVIEKLQGIMASGLTTMKTATSALNMAMGNTGSASKVKEPTTQAAESTTQAPQTTQPSTAAPEPTTQKPLDAAPPITTSSNSINYIEGTNYVIDTSVPVRTGQKYDLTEEDMKYLAYVAFKEQRSVEGAKVELSLMANRYESEGKSRGFSSIRDYVENSNWFSAYSTEGYENKDELYTSENIPEEELVNAVNDVLVDGNRYVPKNVVQHYTLSHVKKVTVNGEELSRNTDERGYAHNDKSQFIPGQTEIYET